MTEEQVNKVVETHKEIEALNCVKHALGLEERVRLSYMENNKVWEHIPLLKLLPIDDILKKHDKMIRQEIDARITELKEELEKL